MGMLARPNPSAAASGWPCSGPCWWSFVPLVETGALAAVCWSDRRILSFTRAIDLFFTGHGPWSLWLIGFSAIWSFFSPATAVSLTRAVWLYGASAIVILWSAYIDFCFFRFVLGRNRTRAGRDLLCRACDCCVCSSDGHRRWYDFRRSAPASAFSLTRLSCPRGRFSCP